MRRTKEEWRTYHREKQRARRAKQRAGGSLAFRTTEERRAYHREKKARAARKPAVIKMWLEDFCVRQQERVARTLDSINRHANERRAVLHRRIDNEVVSDETQPDQTNDTSSVDEDSDARNSSDVQDELEFTYKR